MTSTTDKSEKKAKKIKAKKGTAEFIFDKNQYESPKIPKKTIEYLRKSLMDSITSIDGKSWHLHIPARFSALTSYSMNELKDKIDSNPDLKILWDALMYKYWFYEAAAIKKKKYMEQSIDNKLEDFEFGENKLANDTSLDEPIDFKEYETDGDFVDEAGEFEDAQ